MFGGKRQPFGRRREILGNAKTILVHVAEIGLRRHLARFRLRSQQLCGAHIVASRIGLLGRRSRLGGRDAAVKRDRNANERRSECDFDQGHA